MSAYPANGVQIVVLRVALFAKTGIVVTASGAPFTIAAAGALRSLGFFVCYCNH